MIGGPVIADPALPSLTGRLLWGDFCSGQLSTATPGTGPFSDVAPLGAGLPRVGGRPMLMNAIGEDGFGRLCFLCFLGGVYRLVPGATLPR